MKHVNDELQQMKQADENVVDQACPDPVYLPPRLVFLGQATEMINGNQSSNYADDTHDFYWSGE